MKNGYMYLIGTILIAGFLILLALLVLQAVPAPNSELLYLAVGALIGMVSAVVNYYFGSSKSSADKTELLVTRRKEE